MDYGNVAIEAADGLGQEMIAFSEDCFQAGGHRGDGQKRSRKWHNDSGGGVIR